MRRTLLCAIMLNLCVTSAEAQTSAGTQLASIEPEKPTSTKEKRSAKYDFYVGGIRIAEASLGAVLNDVGYVAKSKVATRGVLDVLIKGRAETEVEGKRGAYGQLSPNAFFSDYSTRKVDQTMTISYQGSGPKKVEYNPPSPPEPFAAEIREQLGTLDPLTAGIIALLPGADSELCNRTIPVFDGTRRFDLIFLPADPARFDKEAPSPESSRPLTRCLGVYERIAGFEEETIEDGRYFPFDIWFEETIEGDFRAIHIAGKTRLGYAVGILSGSR